ncbi:LysM peptidoglycan-binding domain-containing protein [Paenibacillus psychroresistens]|uniref:LysM peptidoglycan-binding domain-containing protein n=1 Tax=Paenibacillus psychroresistens TaxID=1778678 RepID=A0A6B8RMV2_9BACL|nr:LysM peptidoglycan-binding domain-containing protein [Paenibacillus psychroresistens]QGQ96706.1 LysM peptidoglycan-binding domain-containing protein [Paenibacillus psychroresistens]
MNTVDNNPVYFIEEDQKVTTTTYYRSKNQALLNKATQHTWKHKKFLRIIIVGVLLLIAITCGTLIHAFASTHEQINDSSSNILAINTVALETPEADVPKAEAPKVDVVQGDTLWSIANEYAPAKVSVSSYINQIKKLNGLKNSVIQEGQMLLLPN